MPNAENAKLQYEGGQTAFPMGALTNSGDRTNFTSQATLWSGRSGYEQNVKPDGLATGGAVTPALAAGNDNVDVEALTCYLAGVKTSVNVALDETITRPASAVSKINSITVTSGGAVAVIAGTDGSDANFVETRGVAGGPPYIPVGSIELAQVRVASDTAAPITAAEIFDLIGTHVERYDYPVWEELRQSGSVKFASALPASHTADVPKGVYASYSEPQFVDVSLASDFVAPENSYSVTSTQIYGATIGSASQSLGQGGFSAYLNDGIGDPLMSVEGENLWFKFLPNRYQSNHILSQGKLGIARTYPASENIVAACTISAEAAAQNVVV